MGWFTKGFLNSSAFQWFTCNVSVGEENHQAKLAFATRQIIVISDSQLSRMTTEMHEKMRGEQLGYGVRRDTYGPCATLASADEGDRRGQHRAQDQLHQKAH